MDWAKFLRGFLILFIFALIPACRSNHNELPALGADISKTSVSGLSAGGYMAGQFHVAHSRIVTGAGILAAGPFGCAQSSGADAFPLFPASAIYNLAQAQNGCMADNLSGLGVLNTKRLTQRAASLAEQGQIDPLSGLQRSKVYLYSGADDQVVARAVVEAAREFYLDAGVPQENIEFVTKNPGGHAFLTAGEGEACGKSDPPYVSNCHYDQAGEILRFIYGALAPRGAAKPENFVIFEQGRYASASATLSDEGAVYVPSSCRAQGKCRVHIVFHGCNQSRDDAQNAVIRQTGFADWADSNNIIVLFPQVAASQLNPKGCWDWWGYTGAGFLTRSAPQIRAVDTMLSRLAETAAP